MSGDFISEDRLRKDGYEASIPTANEKESIYPYIPISYYFLIVIEAKYAGILPYEAADIYTRNFTTTVKSYDYYQRILSETGLVIFSSTERGEGEFAYSKFIIKRIITLEEWGNDPFKSRDIKRWSHFRSFNYFDYMEAWCGALLYDNRQRKHTWWAQFQLEGHNQIPMWFVN